MSAGCGSAQAQESRQTMTTGIFMVSLAVAFKAA
jgi:hypothetical protein